MPREWVNVLFVDDEPMILHAMARAFRDRGVGLVFTSNPLEVERLIVQHRIDVLVTDYMMPERSGIDVVAAARRVNPQIVSLMMSGAGDFGVAVRAINEGHIFSFLEKPCPMAQLHEAVHQAARFALQIREVSPDVFGAVRSFGR